MDLQNKKKKRKKVSKQCDLMSVGINLFLWWMSHFRMRLCKLFSEKIMNRHPTQGHKNNPYRPGSLRSVMNQHYPSGAANCWEISGNSWKGDSSHISLLCQFLWVENKHGNQVKQPEEFNKTRSSSAWCSPPVSILTISLLVVLILRLEQLQKQPCSTSS